MKLKIIIAYTPNPININNLIFDILQNPNMDIIGVIETNGSKMIKRSLPEKINYFFTLNLIVGPFYLFGEVFKVVKNKIIKDERIQNFCQETQIDYLKVNSINDDEAVEFIKSKNPDIMFNQSHHLIKEKVFEIPERGVLNIHGGFLPKYRGNFTSFWQLFNGENNRGICIHLIDKKLDNGKIVYQKIIPTKPEDTVRKLIREKFELAPEIFNKALNVISQNNWQKLLQDNNDAKAKYWNFPTMNDALKFRMNKITYWLQKIKNIISTSSEKTQDNFVLSNSLKNNKTKKN